MSKWLTSRVVVLYRFSTSNHNRERARVRHSRLYYIVSLHQTTTVLSARLTPGWLYYIVSLHQTTTCQSNWYNNSCCIISFLYIKPQRCCPYLSVQVRCIISFLYIKPQLDKLIFRLTHRCIISFLYIKPQPNFLPIVSFPVVLYRFSTSNHN